MASAYGGTPEVTEQKIDLCTTTGQMLNETMFIIFKFLKNNKRRN
ncbi:hypothetical protein [Terrihalobacillus insolitus]|nr:hypothetical protein [Terrihalobacillus insolitus]